MVRTGVAILAAALMALALAQILAQSRGLTMQRLDVDGTPVTLLARPGQAPAPAVVIAHGFAGSQELMRPFATTLARAGYVTLSYDALGHGRHPRPLPGDVTEPEGATAALVAQAAAMAAFARGLPASDGRVALLGHSMASDVVVRAAIADPGVAATVAVSLFSPAVTATAPRNLLVVTGAWEAGLREEALRVAGLATGAPAEPSVTLGDPAEGTARRAVLAPRVEHVGVLYSPTAQAEARDWLNLVFDRAGAAAPDARGGWILVWVAGALGLGWGAAPLLPRLAPLRPRAGSRRAGFALVTLAPAIVAPLAAGRLPEGLLPAPVADYLGAHFLAFGLVAGLLAWRGGWAAGLAVPPARLAAATAAFVTFALLALYLPIDRFVTAFAPSGTRVALLAALFAGMLPYFLADEIVTRSPEAPRLAYPLSKLAFVASLMAAIALDPPRLFFLILILPVTIAFFALFGLLSRWSHQATGSPLPAAIANAFLFAWAVAVTFPLLGG
jgi:hypothetical protein